MEIKIKLVRFLKYIWNALRQPLLATIIGLGVGAIIILLTGKNPVRIYIDMFDKSFFSLYYLLQTLTRATPIILCAIATAMAWRAGHINIGVQGQMVVGGFVAAICAVYIPGPPVLIMILSILLAIVSGALYASIAAVLEYKFNVSLVICTLMLNYIANFVTTYFISGPVKAISADPTALQTEKIPQAMQIWNLVPQTTFNFSFVIAIVVAILFVFFVKRTVLGYEIKATGLNAAFSKFGGIKPFKILIVAMLLSGGIAGLAGAGDVFGYKHCYVDGMLTTTSYAWTGLMAALMAGLNPVGLVFSSILLAGFQVGGQAIQRTAGIPMELATIIQATITIFVSVKFSYKIFAKRKINDAGEVLI